MTEIETNNELKSALTNIKQPTTLLDEKFQKKLIKLLIEDEKFSEEIFEMIHEEYFDGLLSRTLVHYITKYYHRYNLIPQYDTLVDIINDKEKDEKLKNHLVDFIGLIEEFKITDKQHVKDFTRNFCRKQALKKGLLRAAENWEKGNYEDIYKDVTDALNACELKNIGFNFFDDIDKILNKEIRNPVPFIDGLDSEIQGGLAGGELGVIVAPTGGGKSMLLVKGACTSLAAGKNVLYYSLELDFKAIGQRFASCFSEIKLADILHFPDVVKEKVKDFEKLGGKLEILDYGPGEASINTLRADLKRLGRKGFIPDVLYIDYADILKPITQYKEMRFVLKEIYEGLRALAKELGIPIWTACQAGRQSINEAKFDLSVISESLGKAQTADVILGLARTDEDKALHRATLMILKNRNGRDGFSKELFFNTSNLCIYVQAQDAMIGLSNITVENQIKQNSNRISLPKAPPSTASDFVDDEPLASYDDYS